MLNLLHALIFKPCAVCRYHGAYFLQYAMLQCAMDCDAKAILDTFEQQLSHQSFSYNLESAVRVQAHYYIETRDWWSAAALRLEDAYKATPAQVWDENAWTRVYISYLNTVGRAVLGHSSEDITAACSAVQAANNTLVSNPKWYVSYNKSHNRIVKKIYMIKHGVS